jgi:MFS family permease
MAAELVTATAGGAVLTAWALHLGAGAPLIALLGALPFLAQLAQFPSAYLTDRFGPKRVAVLAVGLSRQALLPLAALSSLGVGHETARTVLLWVGAAHAALGVVGNNAWTAWMGELVPSALRGRYFGRRTAMCTLANAVGALGAGLVLDAARGRGLEGEALSMLALVACLAGAGSTLLMRRQQAPEHTPSAPELRTALAPFADPGAKRLLAYVVPWNLAIGVSASFFAVHMVRNLGMGFSLVALHAIAAATVRMLTAPLWGRLIDRAGARPVLVGTSFLLPVVPALWLLPTPEQLWPVWLDALLAGTLWSGHNLASFHLPLTLAPRAGRPFFLAAFQGASGLAFATSAAAGGLLVQALPSEFHLGGFAWTGVHALFLLSSLGRLVASFRALHISEPGSSSVRELLGVPPEPGATPAPAVASARGR